jgi:hypothetical protein
LVLGIIILALILLPGLARRYVVSHSKELLGRQISIEHVRLNYFTTTLRVSGFKMYEADEKEVFASFDKLLVNLQPMNLLRNELVIEQFSLIGLYIDIIRKDTTFNFDDLVAFHTAHDTAEADTTPSKPLSLRFSDLEIKQANILFDDQNVKKTTQLRDFSFFIPFIALDQEQKSEAGLKFLLGKEGFFESSLQVDPVGGEFTADISIHRFHLDAFQEYIDYYSNIDSLKGIFSSDLHVAGNMNILGESVVSGKITIEDLLLTDPEGQKFLGASRMDIGFQHINYSQSHYQFDTILLKEPYVHLILNDSTNNISEIFASPTEVDSTYTAEAVADSAGTSATDSLFYSLNAFVIENGTLDYTDNLTGEPFKYHLDEIVLNADSISSKADWVDLFSDMKLNDRGTLQAKVGFNPLDPANNIKLDYVITDFMLSDLNIYSRFYMGFPVVQGNMFYKSETQIIQGQLTSENKLVITDVELGDKTGGIYDLPIKFALYILKDRYGVINLDVPVRGDLNDPRVKIGKIVWNTFKNLIIKVATAPYDALSKSVGATPEELQVIHFDYIDTTLTAQRQRQLDLLLELEQQKEGLAIELIYFNDITLEQEVIVDQLLKNRYTATKMAEQFANSRIDILERYLHSVNDSTAIRILVANPADPKNVAIKPEFEIVFSLK